MPSPYRNSSITHKRRQKTSNTNLYDKSSREHDLKGHQLTLKDLKRPQKIQLD